MVTLEGLGFQASSVKLQGSCRGLFGRAEHAETSKAAWGKESVDFARILIRTSNSIPLPQCSKYPFHDELASLQDALRVTCDSKPGVESHSRTYKLISTFERSAPAPSPKPKSTQSTLSSTFSPLSTAFTPILNPNLPVLTLSRPLRRSSLQFHANTSFPRIARATGAIILSQHGVIRSLRNWGTYLLAKPITKNQTRYLDGQHFVMRFDCSPATQQRVQRMLKFDPRLLRFGVTKLGNGSLGDGARFGQVRWTRKPEGERLNPF